MDILYQDDELVIVDKPSGLLVHRGWAQDRQVAMTMARDRIGRWVYPVHRLDRGASGVLVFALDPAAAAALGESFAGGAVHKRYLALVRGAPPESGVIDHPIPRREGGPRVPARTEFRRLAAAGRYALVEAVPHTGRLHQIRRHLKHIACPLIGDVNYGKGEHNRLFRAEYDLSRLALHAHSIRFPHPRTSASIEASAPLPPDLAGALRRLGIEAGSL